MPELIGNAISFDNELEAREQGILVAGTRNIPVNGFHRLDPNLRPESRVVFQGHPSGVAIEQYRQLRRNLMEQFPGGAVLMVTSPVKGDGKTMNAVNLACAFADASAPTLLIEADLRLPRVAEMLGFQPMHGVESAMAGEVAPEKTVVFCNGLCLHVAAVNKPPIDSVRALRSAGTKNLLQWARSKFTWIIVDCPPVIPTADVGEIAPMCDAALVVVRAKSTPVALVKKSMQLLGERVRGVILNEATLCWDLYYSYLRTYRSDGKKK